MKRSLAACLAGLVAPMMGVFTFGVVPAAAAPPCGIDLAAPEVAAAASSLRPPAGMDASWSPVPIGGNFNRCAPLSTALVRPAKVTATSPIVALMFHNGRYVGRALPQDFTYLLFDITRSTDDTVALTYRNDRCDQPTPAHTELSGSDSWAVNCWIPMFTGRFQWQGDHVNLL